MVNENSKQKLVHKEEFEEQQHIITDSGTEAISGAVVLKLKYNRPKMLGYN